MKAKFVNVRLDSVEDLTFTESAVLSYLAALSTGKRDYVFATTKHLSDTFKCADRTILRVLKTLEKKNLIQRITTSTGYGKERKIYVNPSVKMSHTYV